MKIKSFDRRILPYLAVLILLPITLNWLSILPAQKAKAASLTAISDTMSINQASSYSNHVIKFTTPTGIAIGSKTLVFTFTGVDTTTACGAAGQNKTLSYGPTTGLENSLTLAGGGCGSAASGIWGFASDATTMTLTSPTTGTGAITAGSVVVFNYDPTGAYGLPNSATPGTYKVAISGNFGDTGSAAIVIVADDTIGVSANVDPTLAFTLSDTTLNFGSLTTANVRYANDTTGATTIPAQANTPLLTASTNGVSGVLISVYDVGNGTGGLYSSTVSDLIPAAAVNGLVAGNKKFGVTGLSGSSLTAAAGFNGTGAGGTGVISNVAQSFASSAGPVASGNIAMIMVASIDALTHAGAYSDIVTVVCTGRF